MSFSPQKESYIEKATASHEAAVFSDRASAVVKQKFSNSSVKMDRRQQWVVFKREAVEDAKSPKSPRRWAPKL